MQHTLHDCLQHPAIRWGALQHTTPTAGGPAGASDERGPATTGLSRRVRRGTASSRHGRVECKRRNENHRLPLATLFT